tara:strand:+ start:1279 stop:1944 length:666 start_codon:yes stop_codon:yes gene_type:complete
LNLVVIDTSTRFAGVGVQNFEGKRTTRSWHSSQNHGRELMSAVVDSLGDLNLEAKDVTHVAAALGPGGFSAIRVGISAALGLAVSSQLPVLGVTTHDVELEKHADLLGKDHVVYTLLPAGRNEVSWTRHSKSDKVKFDVSSPEFLADRLEANAVICGEACDLMVGHVDSKVFRGSDAPTRDPNSLLDIATRKFAAGESTAYESLRPIYARPPSISKPKTPK